MHLMTGFYIIVGLVVSCLTLFAFGIHDADPLTPFRALVRRWRRWHAIRTAKKLRESWLAAWPETEAYHQHIKDYTGRLHELPEDGFEADTQEYRRAAKTFDWSYPSIPRVAHDPAPIARHLVEPSPPWSNAFAEPDPVPVYWESPPCEHYAGASPRAARVQRYLAASPQTRLSAWTGTIQDANLVDLTEPGLGAALVAQAPETTRSWAQMLGRLDRKRAAWYARAWAAVRRAWKREHVSLQSNAHGFAVGDGPLKMSGFEGEWFVTDIQANTFRLRRPNVFARVWRWATGPIRRWWRARLFRKEFTDYPEGDHDDVSAALTYGMLHHKRKERE